MPWKGVSVSEQRQRFLEDYQLNYYTITELAERFSISPKTAHNHPGHQGKWIDRFERYGQAGYQEQSRRPYSSCPWQTEPAIAQELVPLRQAHPHWAPRKLLNLVQQRHRDRQLSVWFIKLGIYPELPVRAD